MNCCRIVLVVFALLGIALIIVAAVLGFKVIPDVIDEELEKNVILDKNGTDQFDRFVKLPVALNFSIFFFAITNPSHVLKGGKPIVSETKKITYLKQPLKKNIVIDDKRKTIKYEQLKVFNFSREYSDIDEDHEITIMNVPLMGMMQIFENIGIKYLNNILVKGYPTAFQMPTDTIFHQIRVAEYALQGYKFCNPDKVANDRHAKFLCAAIRLVAPPSLIVMPNKEIAFSFYSYKNNTSDGVYEVEQGVNDIKRLAEMVTFRGKNKTDFWLDDGNCNDIKGTDSLIYAPFNDKNKIQFGFTTDVCQVAILEYSKEIEYEGISGYRYSLKERTLNTSLPENQCYCTKKTRNLEGKKECFPYGFTDLQTCLKAPIILSLPHMLWTDREIAKTVDGLSPNVEKHEIYVDLEPNTGTGLRGHKRIQFNMILRNYDIGLPLLSKLQPAMMPLLWMEESVDIPENLQDILRDDYLIPVNAVEITKWVLIGIGIVMFVGFTGLFIYKRRSP